MRGERDLTLSATTKICLALGLQFCKTEDGAALVPAGEKLASHARPVAEPAEAKKPKKGK